MKHSESARLLAVLAATGWIAVSSGCKDSNSITGIHLTPTPIPPAFNVAGVWTGTFDSADFVDCDPGLAAQAAFAVDGQNVTGTLNAPGDCGFQNVVFQGTIQGNTVKGTVAGASFTPGSTASGGISGSATLELTLTNSHGFIPGGAMHLHR